MMIDFINRKLLDMYRMIDQISNWGYEDWLEKKEGLNKLLLGGESKISFVVSTSKEILDSPPSKSLFKPSFFSSQSSYPQLLIWSIILYISNSFLLIKSIIIISPLSNIKIFYNFH